MASDSKELTERPRSGASDRAEDPLAGFEQYQQTNWDGYGADPISDETMEAARDFVRRLPRSHNTPEIASGSDGTIGLEWVRFEGPVVKLFIDIGPGSAWSWYWRRSDGNRESAPRQHIDHAAVDHLFDELTA